MGFEPTTSTLARLRSTPELRPRSRGLKARRSYAKAGALQGRSCRRSLSLAALRQIALKVSILAMPKTPKQLLARLDELRAVCAGRLEAIAQPSELGRRRGRPGRHAQPVYRGGA